VVVLLALVLLAVAARRQLGAVAVTGDRQIESLPTTLGTWMGRDAADFSERVVAALGVDAHVNRTYAALGRTASVYVGYYRSQEQGAAIHSPLNCMPGAGWEMVRAERVPFAGGAARHAVVRKGPSRYYVIYWYQSATRVEGDEYRSRFYMILDTMRHGRNDAALVRVMVPFGASRTEEAQAARYANDLAERLEPEVRRVLFPG
jgi:EpsI family protein